MTLIKFKKRDPATIFERVFHDDFFDEMFHRPLSVLNVGQYGKVNVIENDNDYIVEVSLPGADKSDVNIEIVDGCMTIQSTTNYDNKDEGKNYIRQEFNHSVFKRSFTLPDDIKETVDAEFKDGILYVKLEKASPVIKEKKIKKIEIK